LASESNIKTAEKIFSSVGQTFNIEEIHMNAVTGLSGSGPAFIYEVVAALRDGGMEAGLTRELSNTLAELTMLGSVKTLLKTKMSPEELKTMVASPGGTTVAGLRVMEEANFKATLQKAVIKASARAKEISEEFEKSL
jgi:pyrroline-5-carboxylate reductase